jgi:hypothetical protein
MSSETGTTVESIAWVGITFGLAWLFFGIQSLAKIVPSDLVTNQYFLGTLAGVSLAIPLSVVVVGVFLYPFAALLGERIIQYVTR